MGRINKSDVEAVSKKISPPALRELKVLANNKGGAYVDGRILRSLRRFGLVFDGAEGKVKINALGKAVLKAVQ